MTATTRSAEGETPQPTVSPAAPAAPAQPAPASLLTQTSTDRCVICSAELTLDQRYCVECGTRRGKPRFQAAKPARQRDGQASTAMVVAPRLAGNANATRLLAVAVVLIALGVGVLIGNSGQTTTIRPTVTVIGSGSGATPSTKSGATSSSSTKSTTKGKSSGNGGPANGDFFGN